MHADRTSTVLGFKGLKVRLYLNIRKPESYHLLYMKLLPMSLSDLKKKMLLKVLPSWTGQALS